MNMPFQQSAAGEYVAVTYRQRVTLASGRFAMVDDGLGLQHMPWTPSIEKHIGQHAASWLAFRLHVVIHLRELASIAVAAVQRFSVADQAATEAVVEAQIGEMLDVSASAEHGFRNRSGRAAIEPPYRLAEDIRHRRAELDERPSVQWERCGALRHVGQTDAVGSLGCTLIATEAGAHVACFDGSPYDASKRTGCLLATTDTEHWDALMRDVFPG
jgi:hypothetical protein